MGRTHRRWGPGELHFPRVLGQERFPRQPRRAAEETTPRGEEHVDLPLHPWALPLLWRVEGARLLRPPPPRSAVPPLNPIQAHLRARTGKGSNRFRTAGGGTPVHGEVDPPSANPPPPSSPPEDWGRGREPEEVVGARCSEVSCLNPLVKKGAGEGPNRTTHSLPPNGGVNARFDATGWWGVGSGCGNCSDSTVNAQVSSPLSARLAVETDRGLGWALSSLHASTHHRPHTHPDWLEQSTLNSELATQSSGATCSKPIDIARGKGGGRAAGE